PVLVSVAMTRANRPSVASASAIAPLPVPRSIARPPGLSRVASSTACTSSSVSARGISTRSSTRSVRWRNAARPTAYANGIPCARRPAAARASCAMGSASTASWCAAAQNRGASCSAATMSDPSRAASGIPAASSTRASSRTSALTRTPAASARGGIQQLLDFRELQSFDERIELAIERARELVAGEADAMIGHGVLREVVGADLVGTISRSHLRPPHLRALRFLLADARVQKPRAQHFHRLELILQLRLLVLLLHDGPGR